MYVASSHIRSTATKKAGFNRACTLVLAPCIAATVVEIFAKCWRFLQSVGISVVSFIFTILLLLLSLCTASKGSPSYIDKKEIVILGSACLRWFFVWILLYVVGVCRSRPVEFYVLSGPPAQFHQG